MADAVVDVGLGGEGDALGDLLVLLVDLVRLLDDHVVTDLAELECRNSDNAPLDQIFQNAKKKAQKSTASPLTHRLAISPAILYLVTTKSLAMVNSSLSDSESDIFKTLKVKIFQF